MSRIPCRAATALAAVAFILLSSRPAAAQVGGPGPPKHHPFYHNSFVNGSAYEVANQAKAEHQLRHVEGKLERDAANCNEAASERHARRAEYLRYRIAVDEWLIRKQRLQCPGFYPPPMVDRLDAETLNAIGRYSYMVPSTCAPQTAPPPSNLIIR